jgi:hypothetical protein
MLVYALALTLPLFDNDFKHETTRRILKQSGIIFLSLVLSSFPR